MVVGSGPNDGNTEFHVVSSISLTWLSTPADGRGFEAQFRGYHHT
jgi:hypothetical protein